MAELFEIEFIELSVARPYGYVKEVAGKLVDTAYEILLREALGQTARERGLVAGGGDDDSK